MNKLNYAIRQTKIGEYIKKYDVELEDKTLIINKKIPVSEFIILRENIRKLWKVDNIIVDANMNK